MQIRCPHCRNSMEAVSDTTFAEINCPLCGSSFSLISGNTTETFRGKTRRLGHFELVRELGMGKFGSVWMARDTELDRTVAIKIPRNGALDADEAEMFLRDARAAAQLKHPNIVGVHEVGRDGETLYIVSDYVEGANLKEWLSTQRMSFRESAELIVKVAEALDHAHQAGVVHRDLKPGNIMLDRDAQPFVIDFGLAKRETGEITMTIDGHVLGTPAYMSPEQAKGKGHEADRRSDVYSLGVILFELLTGELPFRGDKQMLLLHIQRAEAPRLRRLNAHIPRDLETIALKCLEKEPAKRYESAQELADDLNRWLKGEPIQARPIGRVERGWRWCKRNPAAALLLLALVGGIVGTSSGLVLAEKARQSESAQRKLAESERDEKEKARRLADASRAEAIRQRSVAELAETKAISEAERNRRLLYASDVQLASQVWQSENGTAQQARDVLRAHVPRPGEEDLREFAWRYQWSQLRRGSTVWAAPNDPRAMTIAPDSNVLVLDRHGTVQTLDPTTSRLIRTVNLSEDGEPIHVSLARTADAAALINRRGVVRIMDPQTGAERHVLDAPCEQRWVSLSADGRLIATIGTDQQARIWDVQSGEQLRQVALVNSNFTFLDLSVDGNLLLGQHPGGRSIALYEADATKPKLLTRTAESWQLYQGVFSPDGRIVAVGDASGIVSLWDAGTKNLLAEIHSRSPARCLQFSADGRRLAAGDRDGRATVWDVAMRQRLRILKGHTAAIEGLAFAPDGKTLASVAHDGTTRLWDVADQEESRLLKRYAVNVDSVAYSADGRWLAAGTVNGLWLHGLQTPNVLKQLYKRPVIRCAFSADGRQLAGTCQDHRVRIWDVKSGQIVRTLGLKPVVAPPGPMAMAPDDRFCAMAFGNVNNFGYEDDDCRFLQIWDLKRSNEARELRIAGRIMGLACSPDGALLAAACLNGMVFVWDTKNWQEHARWQATDAHYASVVFCRGGNALIAGHAGNGTIDFWDVPTQRLQHRVRGHSSTVYAMALSPDGRTLASVSWDKTIVLWDVATSRALRTWEGSNEQLYAVAFSPDGNTLATSGVGGRLRLWEAAPLEEIDRELSQERR